MKQLLLFTLCLAWLGLAAQPDTTEIKKLKYNNVKFYLGQKRVLKDILMYDAWSLGKLDISPVVADSLADFLLLRKNIVIELGGHSNCIEMQEPKESSLNAANYVKNYLISKGVPADRVQTYGYGKNQPLVACPDSGNVHSNTFVNRRIEAKIVDIVKPKITFKDSVLYSGQVMVFNGLLNHHPMDLDTVSNLSRFSK
ncbi:MAG: OmpA family protein [Sphingobacteriales bacterium JAD_PAG50586_3]|nr:MAG: OmpA family protein [Sphingobacteriales bacterium JAD_PAG50586_3]